MWCQDEGTGWLPAALALTSRGHKPSWRLSTPLPGECLVHGMLGLPLWPRGAGPSPSLCRGSRGPQGPQLHMAEPAPLARRRRPHARTDGSRGGWELLPRLQQHLPAGRQPAPWSAAQEPREQSCRDCGDKPLFIPAPPQLATPGMKVARAGGTQGANSIMAQELMMHSGLWLPPVMPGHGTPAMGDTVTKDGVTAVPCLPQCHVAFSHVTSTGHLHPSKTCPMPSQPHCLP